MSTERVATGAGAAGAMFLTLGAPIRPGNTVLAEWPGYGPHDGGGALSEGPFEGPFGPPIT